MRTRVRTLLMTVTLATGALLLTACVAESAPAPTVSSTASTTPTSPSSAAPDEGTTPLVIPPVADGELARVVFTADGPDGVPVTTGTVSGAPLAGIEYALEGECTPEQEPVEMSYRLTTTDGEETELSAGTFRCDGTPVRNVSVLDTDSPPQINVTDANGVAEAYLVLVPAEG